MSDFEFLRSVSIGQYLPTGSLLHRTDPRARLLAFFCLVMALTFAPHAAGIIAGLLAVLAWIALARIPAGYLLRGLLAPLPFLLFLAAIQVFLLPAEGHRLLFSLGPLHATLEGVFAAGIVLLRFSALILTLSLASACLSTAEITRGLGRLLQPLTRLRFPTNDLVMVVQITLRFTPLLALSAERIARAQTARGAEWGKGGGGLLARARRIVPLIVPLFITSLQRAETLALAMEARGYGLHRQRSSMVDDRFKWQDALLFLYAGLLSVLVILL